MLFSLVKKDFLIVRKYVGIMLIVSFLIREAMSQAAGGVCYEGGEVRAVYQSQNRSESAGII